MRLSKIASPATALLLASALVQGCNGGGGGGGSGASAPAPTFVAPPPQPGPPPGPPTPNLGNPGWGPEGSARQVRSRSLPAGYVEPRGIAMREGNVFVAVREAATGKAAILALDPRDGSLVQVVVTGETLGAPGALT